MKVKELIEKLSMFPGDVEVCCAPNGYDSQACPIVDEVKTEVMIWLSGDYRIADGFPAKNIEGYQKHEVVLLG
jgi:N-acetyl-gamma-glutamylphosphate reductase